jgi:hypothetical protein
MSNTEQLLLLAYFYYFSITEYLQNFFDYKSVGTHPLSTQWETMPLPMGHSPGGLTEIIDLSEFIVGSWT